MAAAEHAAGSGPTAGEYIIHHLTHLQNHKQTAIVDFSVFNLDSIFWATLLGVVGCFVMWRAAKTATSGVPGRLQNFVELIMELVNDTVNSAFHAKSRFHHHARLERFQNQPGKGSAGALAFVGKPGSQHGIDGRGQWAPHRRKCWNRMRERLGRRIEKLQHQLTGAVSE